MSTTVQTHRQQERTELTRSRLLRSAEKIFARDGFEGSKLEEIAADAGYTRGAFYANFESKEDLFMAMLEDKVAKRVATVRAEVAQVTKPSAKLKVLRDHFVLCSQDRDWALLTLEFKLFAVRHPDLKTKLTAMHRRIFATATAALDEIFASMDTTLPVSSAVFAMSLGGLANALEVDRLIGKGVTGSDIKTVMGLFFDAITSAPASRKS